MPHPVDVHVGKQLRIRRSILGLSQDALAKAVGITFQQVQKYERGVNRMSASRLFDFAGVLSVPIAYFFEGLQEKRDYANSPAAAAGMAESESEEFGHETIMNRETLDLLRSFHRIKDQKVRKRMSDLVRAMAENTPVLDDPKAA